MKDSIHKWITDMNEWVKKLKGEKMNEWMGEWMNEWMNELPDDQTQLGKVSAHFPPELELKFQNLKNLNYNIMHQIFLSFEFIRFLVTYFLEKNKLYYN